MSKVSVPSATGQLGKLGLKEIINNRSSQPPNPEAAMLVTYCSISYLNQVVILTMLINVLVNGAKARSMDSNSFQIKLERYVLVLFGSRSGLSFLSLRFLMV